MREVSKDGDQIGYTMPKCALQHFLNHQYGVSMSKELSMTLLPDEAFFSLKDNAFHVLEKKWQMCSGSVDEKIQTGPFKLHEYETIAKACSESSGEEIGVSYDYILSDWFRQDRYRDILDYNAEHGVGHYFSEVPVSTLGL